MKNRKEIRSLTNIKDPSSPLNKPRSPQILNGPSLKLKAIKSLPELKLSLPKNDISTFQPSSFNKSHSKPDNCRLILQPMEPLKKLSSALPPLNNKFQISPSHNSEHHTYKIRIRFKGFNKNLRRIPVSDPLVSLSKDLPYIENVLQENRDKIIRALISPNPVIETYEEAFGDIESEIEDESQKVLESLTKRE